MDTYVILGVLILLALIIGMAMKSNLEKRRIKRARLLVELNEDLKSMQSALSLIPEVYQDIPSKIFMLKRLMQLIDQVQETSKKKGISSEQNQELSAQLEKALHAKDDSVKRFSKWSKIEDQEAGHEIQGLIKFLHKQILIAMKTGLIPKDHGDCVVNNLNIMMLRIVMDLNYSLATHYLRMRKLAPTLSKLRIALSAATKSPINEYVKPQKAQLEKLITDTELKLAKVRKATNHATGNKTSR